MTARPTKHISYTPNPDDALISQLAALSIGLSAIDNSLPSIFLGIKPGLANIITLFAYNTGGINRATWVATLRIISAGLIFGSLGTPGFILSISGSTLSLASLILAKYLPQKYFSLISTSIICAIFHYVGQISAAYVVLIPSKSLFSLIPIFVISAVVTGYINGSIANHLIKNTTSLTPALK